jgi:hypothetical protein
LTGSECARIRRRPPDSIALGHSKRGRIPYMPPVDFPTSTLQIAGLEARRAYKGDRERFFGRDERQARPASSHTALKWTLAAGGQLRRSPTALILQIPRGGFLSDAIFGNRAAFARRHNPGGRCEARQTFPHEGDQKRWESPKRTPGSPDALSSLDLMVWITPHSPRGHDSSS